MNTIQKFKGEVLSGNRIIARLIYWRKQNLDRKGVEFYSEANKFAQNLAALNKIETAKVCGIIAALSPQQAWDVNKQQAVNYLRTGKRPTGTTGERFSKCERIKAAKVEEIETILNGAKTVAFYNNLVLNLEEVCIDRHALAAALLPPSEVEFLSENKRRISKKQYAFFSDCYKVAAKRAGERPADFQAIVWNALREKRELRKHKEVEPF